MQAHDDSRSIITLLTIQDGSSVQGQLAGLGINVPSDVKQSLLSRKYPWTVYANTAMTDHYRVGT